MNEETPAEERSIWRKIWEFPLVVMVVATVVMIAVVGGTGAVLQSAFSEDDTAIPLDLVAPVAVALVAMVIYKLVVRKLGRKKHDDLPMSGAIGDTSRGFAGGAVLISICVALAALTGVYSIRGVGSGEDVAQIVLVTGLYAGVFEEILLRGIIFRWLEEFAGSWIALVLSSLLFGFLHAANDNATFFSSLAIAIEAGILLGAAYMLTRSLWLAIGIHAGWNVVQGLWDVPVSGNDFDSIVDARLEGPSLFAGGGFGLEATVFALVVATSAGLILLWKAAQNGRIVKPMWSRKGHPITAY